MFVDGLVAFLNSHAHIVALGVGIFGCVIILGMLVGTKHPAGQRRRPSKKKRKPE